MEFNFLSKSLFQSAHLCCWKADQHKNHGIRQISTPPGRRGLKADKNWKAIFKGKTDFDTVETLLLEDKEDGEEVTELVQLAINCDPVHLNCTDKERESAECEVPIGIDEHGKLTRNWDRMIYFGYLDRMLVRENGIGLVDDLKTGWKEDDFPLERHGYVLGFRAKHPDIKVVDFAYLYCRSGHYPTWRYEFKAKDHVVITDPQGQEVGMRIAKQDPLLAFVKSAIETVKALPVVPTPGPHCDNWFGAPCQFQGNECPLANDTPLVVEHLLTGQPSTSFAILQGIIDGTITDKEAVEKAFAGAQQLEAWLKSLVCAIKDWAKERGLLQIGNDQYGWYSVPENEVDKVFALTEMLRSEMTIEDIAKVVSIAKTSLDKKISKRQFPQIREALLKFAVSEVDSKPKFGPIQREQAESE